MSVLHDYLCASHGLFESYEAECPIKFCTAELNMVFLKPVALKSDKTKQADRQLKGLAQDFQMSDIKSTRSGDNQAGYHKHQIPEEPEVKEARPGDAAIWGGNFQNINMQAALAGKVAQSVRGESVGVNPKDAGNLTGPKAASYIADHENLALTP
jgi:hypothetical protein